MERGGAACERSSSRELISRARSRRDGPGAALDRRHDRVSAATCLAVVAPGTRGAAGVDGTDRGSAFGQSPAARTAGRWPPRSSRSPHRRFHHLRPRGERARRASEVRRGGDPPTRTSGNSTSRTPLWTTRPSWSRAAAPRQKRMLGRGAPDQGDCAGAHSAAATSLPDPDGVGSERCGGDRSGGRRDRGRCAVVLDLRLGSCRRGRRSTALPVDRRRRYRGRSACRRTRSEPPTGSLVWCSRRPTARPSPRTRRGKARACWPDRCATPQRSLRG